MAHCSSTPGWPCTSALTTHTVRSLQAATCVCNPTKGGVSPQQGQVTRSWGCDPRPRGKHTGAVSGDDFGRKYARNYEEQAHMRLHCLSRRRARRATATSGCQSAHVCVLQMLVCQGFPCLALGAVSSSLLHLRNWHVCVHAESGFGHCVGR